MSRHFGFGKHNRRSPNDDLLMPVGPIWAICIAVLIIIAGAMLLR